MVPCLGVAVDELSFPIYLSEYAMNIIYRISRITP